MVDIQPRTTLQSPAKTTQPSESHGIQKLGNIERGSCRSRAILFKVLADTVDFESKLVVVSTVKNCGLVASCIIFHVFDWC